MSAARGRQDYESSGEAGVHTEDVEHREPGVDPKRQLAAASVTRLTVNIGPSTAEALRLVAEKEGVTVTEALRRLVSYGELLYRAVKIDGKDVLFRDGKETQQVLIA
ncbi:hypothetical protein ACIRSS_21765 [Amycolatopsis sp. NPDC101161]|uniref:hypothetical protein n=1 Tax=Amycolatopsis sp. NPDC101161 TaxID=3363940 RepID=UPI003802E079